MSGEGKDLHLEILNGRQDGLWHHACNMQPSPIEPAVYRDTFRPRHAHRQQPDSYLGLRVGRTLLCAVQFLNHPRYRGCGSGGERSGRGDAAMHARAGSAARWHHSSRRRSVAAAWKGCLVAIVRNTCCTPAGATCSSVVLARRDSGTQMRKRLADPTVVVVCSVSRGADPGWELGPSPMESYV